MNLVVFGASGRTGHELVKQALAAGHTVTAFVRDPARLTIQHPQLRLVQGDVYNAEQVAQAVAGQDAVVSGLGQVRGQPTSPGLLDVAARHIVSAMQQHGVRRLVTVVGAGVPASQDKPSLAGRLMTALLKGLAGWVLDDAIRHVDTIRASGLDWVVVRVPRLSDAPARGTYQVGYTRPGFTPLARADVAAFMLAQLTDNAYLRQLPIIHY